MPVSQVQAAGDEQRGQVIPMPFDRLKDALEGIAQRLEKLANEQRQRKKSIEARWLDDLRQYHGRYDAKTEAKLSNKKTSRVFVSITRNKTHAWESRLGDMLFPTDDKNWATQPTPVPELSEAATRAVQEAESQVKAANEANDQGNPAGEAAAVSAAQVAADEARRLNAEMEEAKSRSRLMEAQIEDQLREAQYNIRCREGLTDMCRLGTEIMKGPIIGERRRPRWRKTETLDEFGQPTVMHKMEQEPDPRPEITRVDPWLFFPEMSARTIEEAEFTFEFHPLTRKSLKALAKRDDFKKEALTEILKDDPREGMPDWWPSLREISDGDQTAMEARYQVWEYHGPLEKEDIEALITAFGDEEWLHEFEINPLAEMNVVVWFCQGHVIKFGPHPHESGETLYSVTPFEKDDTSMFGFGVPYLLRNSQAVMNGAWRMMMDNAGLATGPQLFINRKAIEPADGVWELAPKKIWWIKEGVAANAKVFDQFPIETRQAELERIIQMARQFADEETSMPLIATGEQAAHITTTAQGMSILMNSANVVFRRVVKNYDDGHTTPLIRRMYDWNMAHSKREEIKGDLEIDARGSSALLVRELQSQNMLMMLREFRNDPELGPWLKKQNAMRVLAQTMSIRADDLVKTQEQYDEDQRAAAEAAKNAPPPLEVQLQQADLAAKKEVAMLQRETALMTLAQTHNMKLDELEARLASIREANASKERIFAGEAALTKQPAEGGGGYL